MKNFKFILLLTTFSTIGFGCKKNMNEDTSFATSVNTPSKLKMLFDITQDNSGIVTITPNGETIASFEVFFGDGTVKPGMVMAGENIKHKYGEGLFNVRVVGKSITGQTSEATQPLTVSYKKPEITEMTVKPDANNRFKIDVSAKALYETMFHLYFGDVVNEVPTPFLEGDIIGHTYATAGTYTVKVVALSGGAATVDTTKVVVIKAAQINLPVDFDDPAFDYTVTDFGGAITVDDVDPILATNKIKKTTKPNGAATWAGTTLGNGPGVPPSGFASRIPVNAANSKMSVRVYSPSVGRKIRLKIEDTNNATRSVETEATSTVANAWETLTFDFNNNAPGTAVMNATYNYNMASIFFDFGNVGNGLVFLWDDVKFLGVIPVPNIVALPLDFESTTTTYNFTDFDGGNVTLVNNPFSGGINTSTKVAKMIKFNGQPWGGSFISLTNPINFAGAANKQFKVKVYSPRAGAKLLLKVENKTNSAVNFEKEVATTVANGWETLTFDYSAINTSNVYQNIVFIFDLGTKGDGTANFTFYFDDITLN